MYKKHFGKLPFYIRPFCARSDPALNSGIVPTTLAIKWALSEYAKFTKKTGLETFPIIAPGALPFRGGLTPETVEDFVKEFSGVRTVVIQSAFRYDYSIREVRQAVDYIVHKTSQFKAKILSKATERDIRKIIPWFENSYAETVRKIAPVIGKISIHIPPRRERMQHIGLFGYSRGVGKIRLPRAIGFTASCYSLGIPPELFGVGQGLLRAKKEGKLPLIEELYETLRPALINAGRYLRKESLKELGLKKLEEDILLIEDYLGQSLGPKKKSEFEHQKLVGKILVSMKKGESPKALIEKAAILRRSLG